MADLLVSGWKLIPPWPPTRSSQMGFTPFIADTFGWTHGNDYYHEEIFREGMSLLLSSFQPSFTLSQSTN